MHTRSEHLETFINLTTAPAHVVSAGGVSFTVPAGSPQEEASPRKVMMLIVSFITALSLFGLSKGSAQACKGRFRQSSESHTVTHSRTSGTSKVVCHALAVAPTPSHVLHLFQTHLTFAGSGDTFDICMQCVHMSTRIFNLRTNMKAQTQSATLIRLRPRNLSSWRIAPRR